MGYRTDVRLNSANIATATGTATTSVGLTITGVADQTINLTKVLVSYSAAQQVYQLVRIYDGANVQFWGTTLAGVDWSFNYPLRITPGNNLVVTTSVTVNTVSALISLVYYMESAIL